MCFLKQSSIWSVYACVLTSEFLSQLACLHDCTHQFHALSCYYFYFLLFFPCFLFMYSRECSQGGPLALPLGIIPTGSIHLWSDVQAQIPLSRLKQKSLHTVLSVCTENSLAINLFPLIGTLPSTQFQNLCVGRIYWHLPSSFHWLFLPLW